MSNSTIPEGLSVESDIVLPTLIRRRAKESPDRVFLEHVDGSRMTYGELQEKADLWSGVLAALGVTPGSTVVSLVPTSFETIALWMGVARLRAIEVPVNTAYVGRMLEYVLADSKADVFVVDVRFAERLADASQALQGRTVIFVGGPAPSIEGAARVVEARNVVTSFNDADWPEPEPHDIATIMYTSGTTGASKGVLVTWAHSMASAIGCFPEADFGEDDVWYGPFPLFHVSGKAPIHSMAHANGRVVLREVFNTGQYWEDIRRHGCTATLLMGSTAVFLESQPPSEDDLDHPLEKVLMSPLPDDVNRFKERFGVRVRSVFNMTEISCPIQTSWDLVDGRSCGRVAPGYQCRVVDEHDELVPPGVLGELVVRADKPWVQMAGYWNMPEKTVEAWRNLWFHTGDGFICDEGGNFYFVDRRKDAIRRRGENISSMEVEADINTHPDVMESAVIAIPSEWSEDEVMAVIVRRLGSDLEASGLYDYLVPRMARFMLPRYIAFADELPKTPTEKVRKAVLRDQGVRSDTWDRDAVLGDRRPK